MRSGGFGIYFGYLDATDISLWGRSFGEGNLKFSFGFVKFKMPQLCSTSTKEADVGCRRLKFRRQVQAAVGSLGIIRIQTIFKVVGLGEIIKGLNTHRAGDDRGLRSLVLQSQRNSKN